MVSLQAPPHSRGSSPAERHPTLCGSGSPALAGIIPRAAETTHDPCRLPRTRGDHPRASARRYRSSWAPPHSRGSSPVRAHSDHVRSGSPALAGIIPSSPGRSPPRSWLPRTRGDHPFRLAPTSATLPAPPHSRGSSRRAARRDGWNPGSPALAGIIPRVASWQRRAAGLPRTRGDHPHIRRTCPAFRRAPPHSRGSSQADPRFGQGGHGSPALAGIIPLNPLFRWRRDGLPRTRGDHPRCWAA